MITARRSQLTLLAAITLAVAIAATGWWIYSPQGVRRTTEAMLLLVTGVCGLGYLRRLPKGSPLVLVTTLVGLAVALLKFWR